jgi:hypothetical protein
VRIDSEGAGGGGAVHGKTKLSLCELRTWKTLHFSENKPSGATVKLATVQTRCCK